MLTKPKRLYTYCNKLYFTYRTKYTEWNNIYYDNKPWHQWEEWAVFIGFDKRWIWKESVNYDGIISYSFTILGIIIGTYYSYESEKK